MSCIGCQDCSGSDSSSSTEFYLANPGFIQCGETFQIEAFNARGTVTYELVDAPSGVTLSSTGLLTVPAGTTGDIIVKARDSENYEAKVKIAIYCPTKDTSYTGAGNCCDVIIRLQGCFPITITDAKGRTRVINSDKDFQFIVM